MSSYSVEERSISQDNTEMEVSVVKSLKTLEKSSTCQNII